MSDKVPTKRPGAAPKRPAQPAMVASHRSAPRDVNHPLRPAPPAGTIFPFAMTGGWLVVEPTLASSFWKKGYLWFRNHGQMQALIKHLVGADLSGIAARSIRNCHTVGLDSISLIVDGGKPVVRLFVAREEHDLWVNDPALGQPLSIGYHAHHCDITLDVVHGRLFNHIGRVGVHDGALQVRCGEYVFRSAIKDGGLGFARTGDAVLSVGYGSQGIAEGSSVFMGAEEIHTVSVRRGDVCAWFVYEGRENADHIPLCYTNNHGLLAHPRSDLYERMTPGMVMESLRLARLV